MINANINIIGRQSGASLNSTYAAYFAALPTAITPTVKAAQNQFCIDLGSLLARMKLGYFLHAGAVGNARINLVNPALFTSTVPNGNPTFSEGNGCKSAASTYFNSTYPANTNGINTTHIVYVSESSTVGATAYPFGVVSLGSIEIALLPKWTDNSGYSFPGTAQVADAFVNANHKGLYAMTNNAVNGVTYKDGVKTTGTRALIAPLGTEAMPILGFDNSGLQAFYTLYTASFFIFDRFTDADELVFRTAWETYKTAAGIP